MAFFGLSLTEILILAVGVLTAIYYYLTRNFNYFAKMGIKGPKPFPIIGTAYDFFKKDIFTAEIDWYKEYGPIYGCYENTKPVWVVGDPSILKSIFQKDFDHFSDRRTMTQFTDKYPILSKTLTTMEGEEWRKLRSVVSPTFTTGKIKNMLFTMTSTCEEFLENFKEYARKGESINVKKVFEAYTMNIVASCGFGIQMDAIKNPDHPFVTNTRVIMNSSRPGTLTIIIFMFFSKILKYIPYNFIDPKALKYFEDSLDDIMQSKIKEEKKRTDFLQLLLDARKSDESAASPATTSDDTEITDPEYFDQKKYSAKKVLDDLTIKGQAFQLFFAGFETTSSTLAVVAYCLATNPEAQDKLCEELDEKLGNEKITYEKLSELPYLDGVVHESLRLYSGGRLERQCTQDYQYENIRVKKGMMVQIPIVGIHYDEKYWPEPYSFKPERFLPENRASIQPLTYLPFGAGPRNCVGMRFALLEVKLVLATLLREIKFRTNEKTQIPLKFYLTKLAEGLVIDLTPELRNKEAK